MDVVEYGYNGGAAEAGINRLKSQAVSLNEAFGRVGQSADFSHPFLRSESRVSRSAANMVGNMLQVNNAADAVGLALQSFERATHLGLGLAVGLAVGIAAFEAIKKQIEETRKIEEAFRAVTERPLNLQLGLSVGDLGKQIEEQEKQNAALQAREPTTGNVISKVFDPSNIKESIGHFDSLFRLIHGAKDRINKQDEEAATGSNKANELIKARGALELKNAELKQQQAHGDNEDASFLKLQLDLQQKISALKLAAVDNPNLKAGLQDQIKAAKIDEKLQEEALRKKTDETDVKDLTQQEEDRAASEIANFQGTKGEKEDFSTARSKEKLQNEIDILHAYHDQEGEQKKQLELDELSAKSSEKKAEEAKKKADEDFKSDAELKGATTANKVTALQQSGQSFQANLLKIRETTEQKIATLLHDQKNALAQQEVIAGKLALRDAAKKEFFKTPEERAAAGKAAAQEAEFAQYLKYYQDQLGRGVRFDKSDEKANIARQLLEDQKKLDLAGGKDKNKDFSSVNSLAGQDFSSLAGLAKLDFSGLAKLGALKVL